VTDGPGGSLTSVAGPEVKAEGIERKRLTALPRVGSWWHLRAALRLRIIGATVLASAAVAACSAKRGPASTARPAPSFQQLIASDLAYAQQQLRATVAAVPADRYPFLTNSSGNWTTTDSSQWTHDPKWKAQADARQAGIENQEGNISTHDLGFMFFTSFGNGYRLTGDPGYRQAMLAATRSLATRYSPVVRSIRSWDNAASDPSTDFKVIVDNMMTLSLLWWGASQTGGQRAWYDMAVNHSERAMQENVAPGGSIYQLVIYNADSGAVVSRSNPNWSRGQAWAIYGFTQAYEETHDAAFLATAEDTANYFISHLPADGVPEWNLDAPNAPDTPRDSSAAAIAASALIELSQDVSNTGEATRFLSTAKHILTTLSSPSYLSRGTSSAAILLHGADNEPAGSSDTGLTFGDYYFIEALLRYQELESSWTKITSASTSSTHHTATVSFKVIAPAVGLQCVLTKDPTNLTESTPAFSSCRSPRTYRRLAPARYTFEVRARALGPTAGSLGPIDPLAGHGTPATKRLRIT